MILFFKTTSGSIIAAGINKELSTGDIKKLQWLFGEAEHLEQKKLSGYFIGPRKEMITPWSTNAVEITQNMGLQGIGRIEEYFVSENEKSSYDPMLQTMYKGLDQEIFFIEKEAEPILYIDDIQEYNEKEGLALSSSEVTYLENLSKTLGRKLTDSEVFGFSQVNSEHCRHKIFNGTFVIDGKEMESTLFQLIKRTTKENPNSIVSAYKDNCSFAAGPVVEQFAPETHDKADFFTTKHIETVLSLKAETHNFPTTVEPFNGASTGTGGEIRDRIAGGKGALPIAGTAVYMTAYPRNGKTGSWENGMEERKWLYQSPEEILIKASNGASDFGNKFGQPLINGSLLTFEHYEHNKKFAFDKVIMLAGGIGFAKRSDAEKDIPEKGDLIVVMGGDNYRIGMGGGAVSSVATGEYSSGIELNAVQRANPEMQKRVYNAIRAFAEADRNAIVSIHDHGAGGHLNCLSELVEANGGHIDLSKLPVGDPTLSAKEIAGNESQERMGLVIKKQDLEQLRQIALRERAPLYVVGEITDDHKFVFENSKSKEKAIDLNLMDMFGNTPGLVLEDQTLDEAYEAISYSEDNIEQYIKEVLQLEAVACKDWLTNKVDRSVSGRIAKQQCAGSLQLPLNNLGAVSLDYRGKYGIASAIGHAPAVAMIQPENGSRISIAETLTNMVWAPLDEKLKSVYLSANWMWPAKNPNENSRLYRAVKAVSDFAVDLGINIPTGKDSLSMTQKYKDELVYSPGTVIVSGSALISDVRKIVEPVMKKDLNTTILYIDFSSDTKKLGGSSFAQVMNKMGNEAPDVKNPGYFKNAFNALQELISDEKILAGHDISSGGMLTCLLEMCFAENGLGAAVDLSKIKEDSLVKLLFAENPGVLIQVSDLDFVQKFLKEKGIESIAIGSPIEEDSLKIVHHSTTLNLSVSELRDLWFRSSFLLDKKQSKGDLAAERFENYKLNGLEYDFSQFDGSFKTLGISPDRKEKSGVRAAIIREKGVNGDREMAYALHLAGFDVKDVHMTDLISGRETLEDVQMVVYVGGFSNSDVLGSAKGWAGAFKFNEKAKQALDNFYQRNDTLSLGICNGCQLMVELGLIYPEHEKMPKMKHNQSGKFESAFLNVNIQKNHSVMLKSLEGMKLGVWVAHGEGKFELPYKEENYHIPVKYSGSTYPANPNGSDYNTAAVVSADGRHLAMMPHLERAFFPWQCAHYPEARRKDEVTPWIEAFVNAKKWIQNK